MGVGEASVVDEPLGSQPPNLEERTEQVLEGRHSALEVVEGFLRTRLQLPLAIKQESFHPLLRLFRRKKRERNEVLTFEVNTFRHELLAAFVVNEGCHRIGKGPGARVTRSLRPDRIALNHPAAAQSQHAVQPSTERCHLSMGRGRHVRAAEAPGCKQRPVLKQQHTVVDHGIVKKEIS